MVCRTIIDQDVQHYLAEKSLLFNWLLCLPLRQCLFINDQYQYRYQLGRRVWASLFRPLKNVCIYVQVNYFEYNNTCYTVFTSASEVMNLKSVTVRSRESAQT